MFKGNNFAKNQTEFSQETHENTKCMDSTLGKAY